jgi:tRNA-specific 2-thiouridylase
MSELMAVALSGGVDSSVAAYMLQKEWKSMIGVSHEIWPDSRCCNISVLSRARQVCDRLGIEYRIIDMQEVFRKSVVDDFAAVYLAGNTPNPCVRCNEKMRFSTFYEKLQETFLSEGKISRKQELYFSTGHYVRKEKIGSSWYLKKGLDASKDQSYMLYRIPAAYLQNFVFPLGTEHKKDIVRTAEEQAFESAKVKESQDACFVESDYVSFLKTYTGRSELGTAGEICDLQGRVIGRHRGYINYTRGQRKGLGLGSGPWFVVRTEPEKNRVIVCRQDELHDEFFDVSGLCWFADPGTGMDGISVKIRYNSKECGCCFRLEDGKARVFPEHPLAVTPGQSAVFYDNDVVLGGGIIC